MNLTITTEMDEKISVYREKHKIKNKIDAVLKLLQERLAQEK